jgi:putative acyl-CoA dehydrogenase
MPWPTHTVTNQPPPLADYNVFTTDSALTEGVRREGADWHLPALHLLGAQLGSAEVQMLAELANRHTPELATHDRFGNRIDVVEFHPAWHKLLARLRHSGMQAGPWQQPRAGAHVARATGFFQHAQVEAGSLCPITMTFAAVPVLQQEPALFASLQDKLFSREHDARDIPIDKKSSIMLGMGMTEKQGGSDLRSNLTSAAALDGEGRGASYLLNGHKWFFSAPMCDAHLVLARAAGGLSAFFVPRWRPDGSKNAVQIQRLKDKLGNRSNASSEVEFHDAFGIMVGPEGRGIQTLVEMANTTRLDCVIASSALMRQALVQAAHHARHRMAFGRLLAEQALMLNVLADLALESEAATLLMLRLARAFDGAEAPLERAWRRILTPAAKFWICKRALAFTGECMEVLGGNGYVEESPLARLYREAPVNSIWEGSGNVMCLDMLRAIERDPQGFGLMLAELETMADGEPQLLKNLAALRTDLRGTPEESERLARRIAQRLVLFVQGCLMRQHAPAFMAEAFITSRAEAECGWVFGTLATDMQRAILERACPA